MEKPYQEWPSIMYCADIQTCLGIGRVEAQRLLQKVKTLDPTKKRYRATTAGAVWDYTRRREF